MWNGGKGLSYEGGEGEGKKERGERGERVIGFQRRNCQIELAWGSGLIPHVEKGRWLRRYSQCDLYGQKYNRYASRYFFRVPLSAYSTTSRHLFYQGCDDDRHRSSLVRLPCPATFALLDESQLSHHCPQDEPNQWGSGHS